MKYNKIQRKYNNIQQNITPYKGNTRQITKQNKHKGNTRNTTKYNNVQREYNQIRYNIT